MHTTTRSTALGLVGLLSVGLIAMGLTQYGETVTATNPGPNAFFDPNQALGPPTGTGSGIGTSEVYSLGIGGSITLETGTGMEDHPGVDLVIYENPFTLIGTTNVNFVEACFVEVSSDGLNWARFPSRYVGPPGPHVNGIGLDIAVPTTWFRGLAGVFTVAANPTSGGENPFDIVAGGGDVFDFADLADTPQVLSGDVDLGGIFYVRLVDAQGGVALDSVGTPIWDCGKPASASTDLDAILGYNPFGQTSSDRPFVTLVKRPDKVVELNITDTTGLFDVKTGISMSINGFPVDFYAYLNLWNIVLTPGGVTLRLGPIPDSFPLTTLRIGVEDGSGQFGGDELHLP